ncbi:MAG TPA: hypothetical protein ENI55_06110 [Alphaproteobacteria bacterium]|nr:hypothetical protein [Alphaproteobacteria bacterium]
MIEYFVPTVGQILGLAAVLAALASFSLIGAGFSALTGGTRRLAAVDVFAGWGVVTALFIVLGVFTTLSFTVISVIALGLAGASAALIIWRKNTDALPYKGDFTPIVQILVLALPLLLIAASMRASQWDEFSQWLPNAKYLFRFDAFPRIGLPDSPSVFPAYPYGLPLITYLASKMTGGFVENAGGLANLLLLLLLAPVYLAMVSLGLGGGHNKKWSFSALGVLGVTALSTVFVQKLVLTAYSDSATAVVLAVLGVLAWHISEALAGAPGADKKEVSSLAWQFAWVAVIFLSLKQTNLVLFVILMVGVVVAVLRDPESRLKDFLGPGLIMVAPGIAVYLVWRYYVARNMPGGEFSLMPFERWLIAEAWQILGRMALIASKKGAYFAMMAGITIVALRGLWRFSGGFVRFGLITGAVFLGYNLFLWAMYIAAFGTYEGLRAASFWRYNTQLGLLGATGAAFGLAVLWRRHAVPFLEPRRFAKKLLAAVVVVAVVVAPVVMVKSLRFDIRPQKDHMRMVGRDLAKILPVGVRFAVIDQRGQGLAGKIVNFELSSGVNSRPGLKVYFNGRMFKSPAALRQALESRKITYLWVHEPVPLVLKALGLNLAPAASYLLVRDKSGWKRLRSWPYNGYTDPFSFPD